MQPNYETCASHCKSMYLGGKDFSTVFRTSFDALFNAPLNRANAVTALPRILQEQLGNDALTMEERTALSLVAIDRSLDVYGLSDQSQPNFDHCLLGIVAVSQGDLNKITEEAAFRIESKETCGILFQIVDIKTENQLNISALTGNGDVPLNGEVTALTGEGDVIISMKNIVYDVQELEEIVIVQAAHYRLGGISKRLERAHDALVCSPAKLMINAR
ncbi:MAG: hypothetical protein FJX22_02670 [Alphaproteobacteria bacterium]|nr:hypothetical protein [Alphaproteobacteria bacterium]